MGFQKSISPSFLTFPPAPVPALIGGDTSGSLDVSDDTVGGTLTVSDPDGDDLFIAETLEGSYGTLTITASGDWVYDVDETNADVIALGETYSPPLPVPQVPANDGANEPDRTSWEPTTFYADDEITVQADDGTEQVITVRIWGENDAPSALDSTLSLSEDTTHRFSARSFAIDDPDLNDPFALMIRITALPTHGQLLNNGEAIDVGDLVWENDFTSLTYTPDANFNGTDSLSYLAYDSNHVQTDDSSVLTLSVQPVGDAPSAPALASSGVAENDAGGFVGPLSASDIDGDSISFSVSDERFRVEGDELWLADGFAFDFETTSEVTIRVTASDSDGYNSSRFIDITVLDLNESVALRGGSGGDLLHGSTDADTLTGGMGSDTLLGGAGDDILIAGTGDETETDTSGNTLWASSGDDSATGAAGNDLVGGGAGDDTLHGGDGNDTLFGGDGNDALFGDDGADTLWLGAGDDTLSGGLGADRFIVTGGHGTDVISDFDADEDVLDLSLLTHFGSFAELLAETATLNGETGTLLHSAGGTIFVIGVSAEAVEAACVVA